MRKPQYADLGDLEEDKRIEIIGDAVLRLGKTVGFVTDADPGKAARYISKLLGKFPGIVVLGPFNGPVKGTMSIKVGPPLARN